MRQNDQEGSPCLVCNSTIKRTTFCWNLSDKAGIQGRTIRERLEKILDYSLDKATTQWLCDPCHQSLLSIEDYYVLVCRFKKRFHESAVLRGEKEVKSEESHGDLLPGTAKNDNESGQPVSPDPLANNTEYQISAENVLKQVVDIVFYDSPQKNGPGCVSEKDVIEKLISEENAPSPGKQGSTNLEDLIQSLEDFSDDGDDLPDVDSDVNDELLVNERINPPRKCKAPGPGSVGNRVKAKNALSYTQVPVVPADESDGTTSAAVPVQPIKVELGENTSCEDEEDEGGKKKVLFEKGSQNWPCDICSKDFRTRHRYEYHFKAHVEYALDQETGQYKCTHCNVKYTSEKEWRSHMKQHRHKRPFKCVVCDKTYDTYDRYKGHLRHHTGERPNICSCGKKYIAVSSFTIHLRKFGHTVKEISCSKCDEKLASMHAFKKHMDNEHYGGKRLSSELVSVEAESKEEVIPAKKKQLRNRSLSKDDSRNDSRSGDKADNNQTKNSDEKLQSGQFKNDLKSVDSQDHKDQSSQDTFCQDESEDDDMNSDHSDTEVYWSDEESSNVLEMDTGTNEKESRASATVGSLEEKITESLPSEKLEHASQISEDKTLACDVCESSFRNRHRLEYHFRDHVHYSYDTESGVYNCWHCQEKYTSETDWRSHMKQHREKRPYKCLVCGKMYDCFSRYRGHLRHHTGDLPNECSCGRKYIAVSSFTIHLRRTGHRVKVVSCSRCDEKCKSLAELKQHMNCEHNRAGSRLISEAENWEDPDSSVQEDDADADDDDEDDEDFSPGQKRKMSRKSSPRKKKRVLGKASQQWKRLPCDVCDKTFSMRSNLEYHFHDHIQYSFDEETKEYKCTHCDVKYTSQADWRSHMKQHKDKRPFKCVTCGKLFDIYGRYKEHLRQHTGLRPNECKCGKKFIAVSSFTIHLRKFGHQVKVISCSKCDVKCTSVDGFIKHMRREHRGLRRLYLQPDHNEYNNSEDLTNTGETEQGSGNNDQDESDEHDSEFEKEYAKDLGSPIYTFSCEVCGSCFRSQTLYNHHFALHIDSAQESTGKFKCMHCDLIFNEQLEWLSHVKQHKQESAFVCKHCGKSFFVESEYQEHMVQHKKQGAKKCGCGKYFATKAALRTHLRSGAHTKKMSMCPHCGKLYYGQASLNIHIDRTHYDPKHSYKFNCDTCGRGCNTSTYFRMHQQACERKSDNRKDYLCTICGKTFSNNHGLIVHNRIHTNEKPYKCTYCEKRFRHKSSMEVHLLSHTKDYKHWCLPCGKGFHRKIDLARHGKVHSGK